MNAGSVHRNDYIIYHITKMGYGGWDIEVAIAKNE